MTVIIAYVDGNAIVMASDSCVTESDFITTRGGVPKMWKINNSCEDILIGFAGNCAEMTFIRNSFIWPRRDPNQTLEAWLCDSVQPRIQKAIEKRFRYRGPEYLVEWEIILGIKPNRIFRLTPCGDVEENSDNFNAIGSGREVALGSLSSLELESKKLYSWEKVDVAMTTAEKYIASVRKPFHYTALV
jgi:ATP-dependent protease HslVU (ClpYQ) peptidase subunit